MFFGVQSTNGQILKKLKKKVEHTIDKEFNNKPKKNESNYKKEPQKSVPSSLPSYPKLTIPAPNNNFVSIHIQEFRNLPRIGTLYNYDMKEKGLSNANQRIEQFKQDRKETKKYFALLEMKLMGNKFDQMNTEMPYDIKHNRVMPPNKERVSAVCQNSLLKIGRDLIKEEEYSKYFCNSNRTCKTARGKSLNWGGLGANEFERIEGYKNFVKDNLSDMRSTESKITDEAYLVKLITFDAYDFDKGGFPLNFSLFASHNRSTFEPLNEYGQQLKAGKNLIKILKMSPSEGKEFLDGNNRRQLFAVWKIKYHGLLEDKLLGNQRYSTRKFHLISPSIELFEDIKLTRKIGEMLIK